MWTIRDSQMEQFAEYAKERFEEKAYMQMKEARPQQCATLGEAAARALVRGGVEKALTYGIEERSDVMQYLDLVFEYGLDFDRSPSSAWASTILNMDNPARLKIQQLQSKFGQAARA